MSKAWLVKKGRGWLPADEAAEDMHRKMNQAECAEFRIVRPRSVQWHRLYFALCATIGKNQEPERDADSIDQEIRILSGHYDVYKFRGRDVLIPKRIAFDKMTADEWSAYFAKAELAVVERFGPEYIDNVATAA